jgi:uncharacterized DUF497 family protein
MDLGVAGFEWDKGNREKCQKHGVPLAAVESLLHGPFAVFPDPEHSEIEERFKAIGRTEDGRGVLLVFTLRRREEGRGWASIQIEMRNWRLLLPLSRRKPIAVRDFVA